MKLLCSMAGLILISASFSEAVVANEAFDIMQKSHTAKRVDDQIATLSFRFIASNKSEKMAIYTMVWKNMQGENGYDNKAIFFTESPPDKKGIAYLGWLRPKDSDKLDDEWIYLPELRMTRRIAHRDHEHSHDDDEFGSSLLTRKHLEPRPPELDEHEIIGEKELNGQQYYLISSTPKHHHHMQHDKHNSDNNLAKRIHWIDKNTLRLNRIEFFDSHDKPQLDMQILWTEQQGHWVWQRIDATNPNTDEKTVLTFSDIKINTGLNNRVFGKRSLEKGVGRFK